MHAVPVPGAAPQKRRPWWRPSCLCLAMRCNEAIILATIVGMIVACAVTGKVVIAGYHGYKAYVVEIANRDAAIAMEAHIWRGCAKEELHVRLADPAMTAAMKMAETQNCYVAAEFKEHLVIPTTMDALAAGWNNFTAEMSPWQIWRHVCPDTSCRDRLIDLTKSFTDYPVFYISVVASVVVVLAITVCGPYIMMRSFQSRMQSEFQNSSMLAQLQAATAQFHLTKAAPVTPVATSPPPRPLQQTIVSPPPNTNWYGVPLVMDTREEGQSASGYASTSPGVRGIAGRAVEHASTHMYDDEDSFYGRAMGPREIHKAKTH